MSIPDAAKCRSASKARSRHPDVDAATTMLILSVNDRRNNSRTRNSELRSPTRRWSMRVEDFLSPRQLRSSIWAARMRMTSTKCTQTRRRLASYNTVFLLPIHLVIRLPRCSATIHVWRAAKRLLKTIGKVSQVATATQHRLLNAIWKVSQVQVAATTDPLKTPKCPPCVSKGNLFGVYPFPDESAHVCQIWCHSVQTFDSFNRFLNLWPPKTHKMPPGILSGELYLAYVHFQTNPQTCTKFRANQSSCLTSSQDFWIGEPPKTPWGIEGRIVFLLCPFPDESADMYQIWCQSVNPFDNFPKHYNLWPPKPPPPPNSPGGIEGRIVFSICPFPDESADVYQIRCQPVPPFDSFPRLLNLWPPTPSQMPPGLLRGDLYLAYVHSQMTPQNQSWCQSDSFHLFLKNLPRVSKDNLFAQPLGSFSRICAKVSSAFRRCARWLAQKHAIKQHLYIENYNSGPNMQTSTSLTLFTAIFVAFSGALAEELMIFCRHVRTELYI